MDLRKELDTFYYSTALCNLRLMNQASAHQGITYNSLLYLELIFSMNGTCTASRIAELLYISKPAVTQKINDLIRQGLVIKTPDPGDHRQNLLSVNENALPQYNVYRRQDSLAVQKISDQFSAEDVEKFCQMLHILSDINGLD